MRNKEESGSTNVVNKLWNLVIDKVMAVVNGIMVEEELADDNDDDSSLETAEVCQVQAEENIEEMEAEEISNQNEEISIGDRVMVEDCPGHWSWAQPFQVLAIEGNMVALEMVDELVEISRLKRHKVT